MPHPVFISYARKASTADAQALAHTLGDLAFFDTQAIDDGDPFPDRLLNAVLDARVVVIFASGHYLDSRWCRVELRLAMAASDVEVQNLIIACGDGAQDLLDALPPVAAGRNWPEANETPRLAKLVHQALEAKAPNGQQQHPPLRERLSADEARRIAEAFQEESSIPLPQPLKQGPVALPEGVARSSIGGRFVGRAADLRTLHRALADGRKAAQVSSRIAAGGGFGKTRLAIEYIHRYANHYPGGIFWINAEAGDLEPEHWRVLKALVPDLPELVTLRRQGTDITRTLEAALRGLNGGALCVIDNVPEAEPGTDPPPLSRFFPALGAVTVLATSRQDTQEPGVRRISLGTLSRPAAVLLLTEGLPGAGELAWADWERIAEWVGDLPLALDLLNRALALRAVTPPELRALTEAGTTATLDTQREALRGQVPAEAVRGITEALSLSVTLLDPAAQLAAQWLAQLGPDPIPEALFEQLPPECRTPPVRTALRSRHFLTGGGDRALGSMHRLMADFLRSTAPAELFTTVCHAVRRVFGDEGLTDPQHWPVMNLCRPHAEALFQRGLRLGDDVAHRPR